MVFWLILMMATGDSSAMNDSQLATLIRDGDHKAFEVFFNRHHESLYYMLLGRGVNPETADDIIQRAFIKIWEKRSQIDPDKSLRAYLFRIGYTRALNHFRDMSKFDPDGLEDKTIESSQNTENEAEMTLLLQTVHKAVSKLPEKRRAVFELCFMQGMSYKEAAEALEVSVKTVENQMGHAFKQIRKELAEYRDI